MVIGAKPPSWVDLLSWMPTEMEITKGEFPHLPTLAQALRGDDPLPGPVRMFLADFVEGKVKKLRGKGRPKAANILVQEITDDFLFAVYEQELQTIRATPKRERDHGTPTDLALLETARVAFEQRIRSHDRKPLTPDAIKKRLRNRSRPKRRMS